MALQEHIPQSLFDAWTLYSREIQAVQSSQQSYTNLAQTKTALVRYLLPGWGLCPPKSNKLTEWETEQAFSLMRQISLEQLRTALQIQEQVFTTQKTPSNIRRNYRAALKRFLRWCEGKAWFKGVSATAAINEEAKRDSVPQVSSSKSKTYRYGFGLVPGDVISSKLQEELDDFVAFRKGQAPPGTTKPVKTSTVQRELVQIRLVLGWLFRFKGVSSEQLRLASIIPRGQLDDTKNIEQASIDEAVAVQQCVALATEYIQWLRAKNDVEKADWAGRGLTSAAVELSVMRLFLTIAHFIYGRLDKRQDGSATPFDPEKIPLIRTLREAVADYQKKYVEDCQKKFEEPSKKAFKKSSGPIKQSYQQSLLTSVGTAGIDSRSFSAAREQLEQHEPENPQSDLLESSTPDDWTEVLRLVERLRAECVPRFTLRNQSRKQETTLGPLRSLTSIAKSYQRFLLMALMSYIPPQRQQIYRSLLIPPDDASLKQRAIQGVEGASGYLYKDDDGWYIHLLQDSYKTGKRYAEYNLRLPNIQYPDSSNFYHYIEEWLYAYSYPIEDEQPLRGKGLRQVFQPNHLFLFTKRDGAKYNRPAELNQLAHAAAHKLIGKSFNLHSLRHAFVSMVLKQRPTGDELCSLAAQMGYTSTTIRQYDVYMQRETVELGSNLAQDMAQKYVSSPANDC